MHGAFSIHYESTIGIDFALKVRHRTEIRAQGSKHSIRVCDEDGFCCKRVRSCRNTCLCVKNSARVARLQALIDSAAELRYNGGVLA